MRNFATNSRFTLPKKANVTMPKNTQNATKLDKNEINIWSDFHVFDILKSVDFEFGMRF